MATEYRDETSGNGNEPVGNAVDPTGIEGAAPEPAGKPRKPRSDAGKPRGSRTGTRQKAATSPLDLSGLAGVIVGLTEAVATWRDVPEFGIDPTEATELMGATQNVLRHYSVETTQKGADFIALFGVVSMIVGTRVGAYKMRTRMERAERAPQTFRPSVVPMQRTAPPAQAPQAQQHQGPSVPMPDYFPGGDEG